MQAAAQNDMTPERLPKAIPLFPLPGVILLPRVHLPLNIFEPRYLAMTRAALAGDGLIGIIQPKDKNGFERTGCAGKIIQHQDTDDGRILITLKGVCRFDLPDTPSVAEGGYLRAAPEWKNYADDFHEEADSNICRQALMGALKGYFERVGLDCEEWGMIESAECDRLVSTLAMICPFDPHEKQTLLEAKNLHDRARLLKAIVETACSGVMTCH